MTKEIPGWIMRYTPTKTGQQPPGWFVSRIMDTAEKTIQTYEHSVENLRHACKSGQLLMIRHYASHVELNETRLKDFGCPYEKQEGLNVLLAETYVGCLRRDLENAKHCAEIGRNWNRDQSIDNAVISAEALGIDISDEITALKNQHKKDYPLHEMCNVA